MAILRSHGFTVVASRTGNTTVVNLGPGDTDGQLLTLQGSHDDVAARDACANMAHAELLVGIYMDAGGRHRMQGRSARMTRTAPFPPRAWPSPRCCKTTCSRQ